ncbi:MAG: metal ABC transporter solute-binding protein, Zn/Mn family, partial [Butyricicoccus sp.]
MKKVLSLILAAATAAFCLTACGSSASTSSNEAASSSDTDADAQLRVVTTIFPEYDWVREILGEQADTVDLTMLLDSGVDLHSYQPTAEDMLAISN